MTGPEAARGINGQVTSLERNSSAAIGMGTGHRPLLDIEDVANWLGTSHRHVRRLVAERRIPYVKVGHYVRFDDEDVARWIEGQRVCSAALDG